MKQEDLQQGLATILNGSSTSSHETDNLPIKWVYAVFQRFSERYLTKWTSSIDGSEEVIASEWSKVLRGMKPEQISRGLTEWEGDWPPSAIEFKKTCQGRYKNEHGLNYTPEIYRSSTPIFTAKKFKQDCLDDQNKARQLNLDKKGIAHGK